MKIETLQSLIARNRNEIDSEHASVNLMYYNIGEIKASPMNYAEANYLITTYYKGIDKTKKRIKALAKIQRELKDCISDAIDSNRFMNHIARETGYGES